MAGAKAALVHRLALVSPGPRRFSDGSFRPPAAMIHLYRDATDPIARPPAVLIGRGERMFYLGNEMVKQSVGRMRRDAQVTEAANLLGSIRGALAMRGIALLVGRRPQFVHHLSRRPPVVGAESRTKNGI